MIAIITFGLAMIPGNPMYFQVPMGIIGKVYANSVLVLLNSRTVLGSIDGDNYKDSIPRSVDEFHIQALTTGIGVPDSISEISSTRRSLHTWRSSVEGRNGIMLVDIERHSTNREDI